MKTLVLSDTHLTDRFDERKFNFLRAIILPSDQVIINGDFWDSWFTDFDGFVSSKWSGLFLLLLKKNTIYLNGFSKSYAMTGWRVGYACGPKEVIDGMTKIHQYTIMCVPIMSQMAALEAIKNGEDDVRSMKMEYDRRRRFIWSSLNKIGLKSHLPEGAFYLFPSIKTTGLDSILGATFFVTITFPLLLSTVNVPFSEQVIILSL